MLGYSNEAGRHRGLGRGCSAANLRTPNTRLVVGATVGAYATGRDGHATRSRAFSERAMFVKALLDGTNNDGLAHEG